MNELFLKPAKGLRVRDPLSGEPLAEGGEPKPRNAYWLRRLKDGDVIEAKPPKTASKPQAKE